MVVIEVVVVIVVIVVIMNIERASDHYHHAGIGSVIVNLISWTSSIKVVKSHINQNKGNMSSLLFIY